MDGNSLSREQSPAEEKPVELSKSMNSASRHYRTVLNRLILSRLPLALPPASSSPHAYITGLAHFAPVYLTFESIWERLTQSENADELPLETAVVLSALIHLQVPELSRTERIMSDISVLGRITREEVVLRLYEPRGEKLLAFLAHIELAVEEKPHILIAYAWTLYMALFNGGYWIRTQLQAARDSSWHLSRGEGRDADSRSMSERSDYGLTFWTFPGDLDGQNYKQTFKDRLSEVENMLSREQREDVVQEAKVIFRHCAELVKELDGIMQEEQAKRKVAVRQNVTLWMRILLPLSLLVLMVARWVWSVDSRSWFSFGRTGS